VTDSDYRSLVQNAIEQYHFGINSQIKDFSKLLYQIDQIKEIGICSENEKVQKIAAKIKKYHSKDYYLSSIESLFHYFFGLRKYKSLSNKEKDCQVRYLFSAKHLLHGIDEFLRKDGH
jgi:hypothetical protein